MHISKRYKQCGISRLASKLKYKVCDIGLRKLDHAESITVKRKENHYNHRLNLKSRGSQLTILVYAVVAMQAKVTYWETKATFDTDSFPIGIENRCSSCTSCNPKNFIRDLRDTKHTIKGFMGTKTINIQWGAIL